jgi:hypothetical protein
MAVKFKGKDILDMDICLDSDMIFIDPNGEYEMNVKSIPGGLDIRIVRIVGIISAASTLGRLGGLKGGKARAEKLTAERRKEIAQSAALKRWGK